jgi:hypothetical protein
VPFHGTLHQKDRPLSVATRNNPKCPSLNFQASAARASVTPQPWLYSLSRKALTLYKHSMFAVDHHHFRVGNTKPVCGPAEHLPGKAFALPPSSV